MLVSMSIKPNTLIYNRSNNTEFVTLIPNTIRAWLQRESEGIFTFIYHDITFECASDRVEYAPID